MALILTLLFQFGLFDDKDKSFLTFSFISDLLNEMPSNLDEAITLLAILSNEGFFYFWKLHFFYSLIFTNIKKYLK